MKSLLIISLSVIASYFFTGFLRRYALNKKILDIPNQRSSHTVPTPRGGGLAIALVFLLGLTALAAINVVTIKPLVATLGAGGWTAVIGLIDDHDHIPPHWRLLAHFLGSAWALVWLGGLPPLPLFGDLVNLGWIGHGLAAVYLVWLLNLYNFMDGIDGIAGIEAITVCLGGAVLFLLSTTGSSVWVIPILMMAAVSGFLFWNFPRAKIFMGDVGSGFIGLMLGIMSIHAAGINPALFWGWVIMLGVFVVDATLTLLRRIIRGERVFEAHRSHAYQYASRVYGSHEKISITVGAINLVWLLPIAIAVSQNWLGGLTGVVIGYFPLFWLAFSLNAGASELQAM